MAKTMRRFFGGCFGGSTRNDNSPWYSAVCRDEVRKALRSLRRWDGASGLPANRNRRNNDILLNPLAVACCQGSEKVVRALLRKYKNRGLDLDADISGDDSGENILQKACCFGSVATVDLLLQAGASPYKYHPSENVGPEQQKLQRRGNSLIYEIVHCNRKNVASQLIRMVLQARKRQGLPLQEEGDQEAFVQCCGEENSLVLVQTFVGCGFPVNQPNGNGDTALIQTVRKDVVPKELFKILLKAGANVWARDAIGNTILHLLFGKQNSGWTYSWDLIMLLPWQEMLLAKSDEGISPLYLACKNQDIDFLNFLWRACPWIVTDDGIHGCHYSVDGESLLHAACSRNPCIRATHPRHCGQWQMVRLLLQMDHNPFPLDSNGRLPSSSPVITLPTLFVLVQEAAMLGMFNNGIDGLLRQR